MSEEETSKNWQTSKNADTKAKSFYLSVFSAISSSKTLKQVGAELGISKQALNYYVSSLKKAGFIKKVSYGTWEILKPFDEKEVKKVTSWHSISQEEVKKVGRIRGHAFQVRLWLPEYIRNWDKRADFLKKAGFEVLDISDGIKRGCRIVLDGCKVHLFKKVAVFYIERSFYGASADESYLGVMEFFKGVVGKLEGVLQRNLGVVMSDGFKGYLFKVDKSHYSIIHNGIAREYNREHEKLYVRDYAGVGWLLVDDSAVEGMRLGELETIHPEKAREDNKNVQKWYNEMRETNFEVSPRFILNGFAEMNKQVGQVLGVQATFGSQLAEYGKHLEVHTSAINELGVGVREFSGGIADFRGDVQNVTRAMKEAVEIFSQESKKLKRRERELKSQRSLNEKWD